MKRSAFRVLTCAVVHYRRNFIAGGTYFFTVGLRDRRKTLLVDYADVLREVFTLAQQQKPFRVDAIVVLPDHLHALWTLPAGNTDYPGRWRMIKSRFTRRLARDGRVALSRNAKGERAGGVVIGNTQFATKRTSIGTSITSTATR